jgi:hypothetical protein
MSQLVKMKRQANFKGFKRFGAFKGLVEQKNVVFNSFVCKLGLFWHSWAFKTLVSLACQKRPNLHTNSSNKLLFSNFIIFFFQKFPYVRQHNFYLSSKPLKIKRAIRIKKKNRGFPFKKTMDDVITRKQMTAWNFLWY